MLYLLHWPDGVQCSWLSFGFLGCFLFLFFYFALRQFRDIQEKLNAVSQRKEWICCSSVHFSQWKMGSLVWAFHWLFPKIVFCYGNIRGPEKNNGYRSIKNLLTPFLESFLMARKWKAFHIYLYDLRLALLLKVEFMQLPLCHLSSTGFEIHLKYTFLGNHYNVLQTTDWPLMV